MLRSIQVQEDLSVMGAWWAPPRNGNIFNELWLIRVFLLNHMLFMLVLALLTFRFVYYSFLLCLLTQEVNPCRLWFPRSCDSWFLLGLDNRKPRQEISGRGWGRRQIISPLLAPPSLSPTFTHPLSNHPLPSWGDCSSSKQGAAGHLENSVH